MASLNQLLAKRKQQIEDAEGGKDPNKDQAQRTREAILRAKEANKEKTNPKKKKGRTLVDRLMAGELSK